LLRLEPYPEGHDLNILPKLAGFKIPYFKLDGKLDPDFYRFRFTQTRPTNGWQSVTAEPEKPRRYAQPPNSGCNVYLPPLLELPWSAYADDPTKPLVITEGELKAACACSLGVATIGLGGVYNWRSAKHHQEFLPILERFNWLERSVILCFDSDLATNPMVRIAAARLAKVLAARGAMVGWAALPPGPENAKQGLDDYAFANGGAALMDLLAATAPLGPGILLHELNCDVALVRSTGEIVELNTGTVYSASAFTEVVYKHKHYTEWRENRQLERYAAKEWLAWPYRNEVPQIAYAPEEPTLLTTSGAYNSWYPSQWACQPCPKGSIQPWEDLLTRMFNGVDQTVVQWVRQWFAYPLQHPGAKLHSALLIWSHIQGNGKTMLGETMSYIYGDNYGTVNNTQLASQFNEWLERKQFILGDEIALGDKRHTASALKDMITRSTLRLNSKNRKTYAVRDCINYYMTSNHEDAVYLESGDRRMFVHRVDSLPLAPKEYKAYWKWIREEGGAGRLFHYLLHEVDLADFDPQRRPPVTTAKSEMVAAGRGDTEDWAAQVRADPDGILPVNQPFDLFSTMDLLGIYDPAVREKTRAVGMGRALSQAGIFKVASGNNSGVIEGVRTRFWAVRNVDAYRRAGPTEAAKLYLNERTAEGREARTKVLQKRLDGRAAPVAPAPARQIGATGKFKGSAASPVVN